MSDTPRTDAEAVFEVDCAMSFVTCVTAEFARTLERELAAANAEREAIVKLLNDEVKHERKAREKSDRQRRLNHLRANRLAREVGIQRKARKEAEEKEAERWSQRLNFLHKEYDVDGAGCESGDPLDVIETEIRLALGELEQRVEAAEARVKELEAPEKFHIEQQHKSIDDYAALKTQLEAAERDAELLREELVVVSNAVADLFSVIAATRGAANERLGELKKTVDAMLDAARKEGR